MFRYQRIRAILFSILFSIKWESQRLSLYLRIVYISFIAPYRRQNPSISRCYPRGESFNPRPRARPLQPPSKRALSDRILTSICSSKMSRRLSWSSVENTRKIQWIRVALLEFNIRTWFQHFALSSSRTYPFVLLHVRSGTNTTILSGENIFLTSVPRIIGPYGGWLGK